jgi:hypothetical protein
MMVLAYNPGAWEAETGVSGKANLGYIVSSRPACIT